ncbi:hypothetical protein Clacol_006626 [Clathrus columnatus]|uniref:Uncharacterized protein n=1 Tax=Clathrus columnatus TaxID=1419009 RepID=A0AAV5AI81_9AGAM|nr:hypothetical protein Clacol_006626 [Clathrus columnatus]
MTALFRCSTSLIRLRLQSTSHPLIRSSSCPSSIRRSSDKSSHPPAKPDPTPEYSESYYASSVQDQFGSSAFWAFRNLGKIFAWVGYGVIVTGIATITVYEGGHLWIEQQMRFDQDEDAKAWGWEPELWSGGEKGGTSASLGLYGRHVVRAAWFALHYHSPFVSFAGQSGGSGAKDITADNLVNSDIQTARAYLETALASRQNSDKSLRLDRVTLELLERHASVLERIGTRAALVKAGENYSMIYNVRNDDILLQARYAAKLGNITERLGDDGLAIAWWIRSINLIEQADENLQRRTLSIPVIEPATPNVQKPDVLIKGLTKKGITDQMSNVWSIIMKPTQKDDSISDVEENIKLPELLPQSPMAQRVLVSILLSLSAHYSRQRRLSQAKYIQERAISLIDLMGVGTITGTQTAAEKLHRLFLLHRLSVLHVHHGQVNFALHGTNGKAGKDPLTELYEASSLSKKVASTLTEESLKMGTMGNNSSGDAEENLASVYENSKWLAKDARALLRDARITAAEALALSNMNMNGGEGNERDKN